MQRLLRRSLWEEQFIGLRLFELKEIVVDDIKKFRRGCSIIYKEDMGIGKEKEHGNVFKSWEQRIYQYQK